MHLQRITPPSLCEEDFLHFSLQSLLPPGHRLVLNCHLGTLSHLRVNEHHRAIMMAEQLFSTSEVCVLLPLLQAFPYHVPFETLCASFGGEVTERSVNYWRRQLVRAKAAGTWKQAMQSIRIALWHIRKKLRPFGIEIRSLLDTGYILQCSSDETETHSCGDVGRNV